MERLWTTIFAALLIGAALLGWSAVSSFWAFAQRLGSLDKDPVQQSLRVTVIEVVDGDTFWVDVPDKVRLCHPDRRWFDVHEAWTPIGREATKYLKSLLKDKVLVLRPHDGGYCFRRDKWDRLLAVATIEDTGADVATMMWQYEK